MTRAGRGATALRQARAWRALAWVAWVAPLAAHGYVNPPYEVYPYVAECRPVLTEAERARREYAIYGRKSLWSGDWVRLAASEVKDYNFFKVTVRPK